ncbi:MAG: alpha/beta hydrolase [Aridibacter sp.]
MNPHLKKYLIGEFSFKRLIRSFLIITVLLYVLIMVFAFKFADSLIFQPQKSFYKDDDSIIKIEAENGEKISAKYFQNKDAEFTILFSHGNAEDIGISTPFFEELRDAGFSVLAYDYRGYGTSDGTPSEQNSYKDIKAAYEYLTEHLKIPPNKIIIHGRSLGGAVSVNLASREKCGGLIVESSFISAFRVLTSYKLLPFDKFESINKIKNVKCPILIIHGKRDSIIPFWHGEALFEAANEPKFSLWVDEANHNNLFQTSRNNYLRAIQDFSAEINSK